MIRRSLSIRKRRQAIRAYWRALDNQVQVYLAIALGAMLGGVARALASEGVVLLAGSGFPWGTLFVNGAGSFLIGLYATLSAHDGRIVGTAYQHQFVMTGFCGGFTTFSIFSLETLALMQSGQTGLAAINLGGSLLIWLLAVTLGHLLARQINRLTG
ncbi:CrcB family protein [Nitrincola alkalilacustris]|uniref:CrcB family protein n=1 Tax=Nitrincola alkalilacustris TaxID=1571224 RepID=UPI00124DEE04|nr:CrcB family protein [Nitrincola alkalilacustris]